MDLLAQLAAFLLPLVQGLALKFPILITIAVVMGGLRIIFKPLMALLHSIADVTATDKDNQALDSAEKSTAWKVVLFLVDWFASIKAPPAK